MSHTRRGFRMSTHMPTHHQRCPHTLIAHAISRCFLPPGSTLREQLVAIAECSRWLEFPGDVTAINDDTRTLLPQGSTRGTSNNPTDPQSSSEHIALLFITDPSAPRNERVTAYSSNDPPSEFDLNYDHESQDMPEKQHFNITKAYSPPPSGGNLGPLLLTDNAPLDFPDTVGVWTCSSTVHHDGLRALLRLSILDHPPIDHIDAHIRRLLVQHCAHRIIDGALADELARRAVLGRLTPRDRLLLPPLIRGLSRPKIARKLGLSVATVRHRTTHVYAALGVHSRWELIEWWRSPRSHHRTTRSRAA